MLKWKNDAKISNDADLIYKQGGTMAYIKKKSERKFKITVCNGYKVNGQKRMKAQTITVPSSVQKRSIQQYVMAEAERIEKKFKYGVEESDQTHLLTPTVMCRTRILLSDICVGCIGNADCLRNTTCTPCGISTQRTCCRKGPVNRWQHPCWVMRIRHSWNAPTATRRTWRSVRRQT